MDAIVDHYRENQLAEGVYLGKPVVKVSDHFFPVRAFFAFHLDCVFC